MARQNPWAPRVTTAQRPFRSILFMGVSSALKRPAAVDDVCDAGGERTFVAGEIDGKRSDLFGRAEPSHRLPRDEHLAPVGAGGGGAIEHRGGFDGAGADAITSHALREDIGGDRA